MHFSFLYLLMPTLIQSNIFKEILYAFQQI